MKTKPRKRATRNLSVETIRRLKRVRDFILKNPDKYDQDSCLVPRENCGYKGCILGWAAFLYKPTNSHGGAFEDGASSLKINIVTDRKGYGAADRLFVNWPIQYLNKWNNFEDMNEKQRAKVAAARINHFIKTDGRQ